MAPPAFVALQAEITMLPPLQFSVCSTRLCWGRREHGKIEKSIGLLFIDTISINFPTARRKHANPAYTILSTKKACTSTLFVSKWLGGGLGPGASGSEWGLSVFNRESSLEAPIQMAPNDQFPSVETMILGN